MAGALATRLDTVQQKGGITAREVAQLLNTTPETVSRWRAGRTQPQPDRRDYLLRLEGLISELGGFYPPEGAPLGCSPHTSSWEEIARRTGFSRAGSRTFSR